MGFLKPDTPDRPLDQGMTPAQLADQQRQRRLRFGGAASTTVAGNTTKAEVAGQKNTLGGSV